ncbi:MAG: V-type ATP synthase subunit E [Eubacteriales bacterium]
MRVEEEKLDQFYREIMQDVNEKRKVILDKANKDIQEKLEEKELEFLENAYNHIQEGLKGINREKNEIISKAIMEGKKMVLYKREEIISDIFLKAKKRLQDFRSSSEYEKYLMKRLKNHQSTMECDDECFLYISKEDEKYINRVKEAFSNTISIELDEEMIGGFKIINRTKNLYIDECFITKLDNQRERIYEICKIDI